MSLDLLAPFSEWAYVNLYLQTVNCFNTVLNMTFNYETDIQFIYIYTCIQPICMYTHVCMYTHISVHTYIHIHTYIHKEEGRTGRNA